MLSKIFAYNICTQSNFLLSKIHTYEYIFSNECSVEKYYFINIFFFVMPLLFSKQKLSINIYFVQNFVVVVKYSTKRNSVFMFCCVLFNSRLLFSFFFFHFPFCTKTKIAIKYLLLLFFYQHVSPIFSIFFIYPPPTKGY